MTEYPREVYDLVKQQLDEQFRHQDAFDSKAFFLFGAILVVIGFLVDKQTVASSPVLFWCGLAMLALSLFVVLLVLHPRQYGTSPKPSAIIDRFREGQSLDKILSASADSVARMYAKNRIKHRRRYSLLLSAFWLSASGLVLIGVTLIDI